MRISKLTGLGAALLMLAFAFLAGCGDDSITIMQSEDDAVVYGAYDDRFADSPDPYEPRGDVYDDRTSSDDQLSDEGDPFAPDEDDIMDKDGDGYDPGDTKDGGLGK